MRMLAHTRPGCSFCLLPRPPFCWTSRMSLSCEQKRPHLPGTGLRLDSKLEKVTCISPEFFG